MLVAPHQDHDEATGACANTSKTIKFQLSIDNHAFKIHLLNHNDHILTMRYSLRLSTEAQRGKL